VTRPHRGSFDLIPHSPDQGARFRTGGVGDARVAWGASGTGAGGVWAR